MNSIVIDQEAYRAWANGKTLADNPYCPVKQLSKFTQWKSSFLRYAA